LSEDIASFTKLSNTNFKYSGFYNFRIDYMSCIAFSDTGKSGLGV